MNTEYQFWMVYVEGKSGPTKKHLTLDDARLEAERLCRMPDNRGRLVYVLECTSFCAIEEPPVVWKTTVARSDNGVS